MVEGSDFGDKDGAETLERQQSITEDPPVPPKSTKAKKQSVTTQPVIAKTPTKSREKLKKPSETDFAEPPVLGEFPNADQQQATNDFIEPVEPVIGGQSAKKANNNKSQQSQQSSSKGKRKKIADQADTSNKNEQE